MATYAASSSAATRIGPLRQRPALAAGQQGDHGCRSEHRELYAGTSRRRQKCQHGEKGQKGQDDPFDGPGVIDCRSCGVVHVDQPP